MKKYLSLFIVLFLSFAPMASAFTYHVTLRGGGNNAYSVRIRGAGGSSSATPAFIKEVQQWNYTDSASSETFTITANVAAGNFLVIPWKNGTTFANVITSVTDTGCGSTWSVTTSPGDGGSFAYTYCTNGMTNGVTSITLNWLTTDFNYKWGTILEFSGVKTSSQLDSTGYTADVFTIGPVTLPITTTNASDLIVGQICNQDSGNPYVVGGGFTVVSTQALNGTCNYLYRIVSTAGSYDPAGNLTAAAEFFGVANSFKSGSSSSGQVRFR